MTRNKTTKGSNCIEEAREKAVGHAGDRRYAIDDSRSSSRSCVCLFFVFLIDSYVECARSPTLLLSLLLSVATAAAEIGAAATAAVAVAVPLPLSLLPGQPGVIITSPFCALSLALPRSPTFHSHSLSLSLSLSPGVT